MPYLLVEQQRFCKLFWYLSSQATVLSVKSRASCHTALEIALPLQNQGPLLKTCRNIAWSFSSYWDCSWDRSAHWFKGEVQYSRIGWTFLGMMGCCFRVMSLKLPISVALLEPSSSYKTGFQPWLLQVRICHCYSGECGITPFYRWTPEHVQHELVHG